MQNLTTDILWNKPSHRLVLVSNVCHILAFHARNQSSIRIPLCYNLHSNDF